MANQRVVVRTTVQKVFVRPTSARGPQGEQGASGDANEVVQQVSAAAVWVVPHGLNKLPSVETVDTQNRRIFGVVVYDSLSQVTVTFSSAVAGKTILN